MLVHWADTNDYQLIHHEYRMMLRGPFFLRSSNLQIVFYVAVIDKQGQKHSGYVCFGNWLAGLLSNETRVIWDEPSESEGKF